MVVTYTLDVIERVKQQETFLLQILMNILDRSFAGPGGTENMRIENIENVLSSNPCYNYHSRKL